MTETHYLCAFGAAAAQIEDTRRNSKHLLTESGMGYRFEA